MPRMKLTSAAVDKIKPPATGQIEYFDQLLLSFGLRVSYKGTKSWFIMTRLDGRLIRMTIGKVQAMPLVEARDGARRLINLAIAGKDPRLEKSAAKREREVLPAVDAPRGAREYFHARIVVQRLGRLERLALACGGEQHRVPARRQAANHALEVACLPEIVDEKQDPQ